MTAYAALGQAAVTSDERILRAALAAYLGRYRGQSRLHTGSDLKIRNAALQPTAHHLGTGWNLWPTVIFLTWCADQGLDPLCVGRVDVERYMRWLQGVRCYQPSTVWRRLSVVVGFYRVCVIDQVVVEVPDQ